MFAVQYPRESTELAIPAATRDRSNVDWRVIRRGRYARHGHNVVRCTTLRFVSSSGTLIILVAFIPSTANIRAMCRRREGVLLMSNPETRADASPRGRALGNTASVVVLAACRCRRPRVRSRAGARADQCRQGLLRRSQVAELRRRVWAALHRLPGAGHARQTISPTPSSTIRSTARSSDCGQPHSGTFTWTLGNIAASHLRPQITRADFADPIGRHDLAGEARRQLEG